MFQDLAGFQVHWGRDPPERIPHDGGVDVMRLADVLHGLRHPRESAARFTAALRRHFAPAVYRVMGALCPGGANAEIDRPRFGSHGVIVLADANGCFHLLIHDDAPN
jgi:hypothetical protein